MIDFNNQQLPSSFRAMVRALHYKDYIQKHSKKTSDSQQFKLNLKARYSFVTWHLTELRTETYLIEGLRSKYSFAVEETNSAHWQVYLYSLTSAIRWSAILFDPDTDTSSISGLLGKAKAWNKYFNTDAHEIDKLISEIDQARKEEQIKHIMNYRNKVFLHVDVNEFLKVIFAPNSSGLDVNDLKFAQAKAEDVLTRFGEIYFSNAKPFVYIEDFVRGDKLLQLL